ncbi:LysR family transcriptional regulator [Thalassovita mangrovi]|uniref:LysR family transcriptional regulator n=1 Tax=Thalassovita mangrovi TaxID=2692236 RepID=UPI001BB2D36F|nr:LysR family transcriptional regulator [Thalassovita mangrovi]
MLKPYEQRFPWNLDWNLLRTFMVVVEQRGISKAADFLGLKQPTISSALKRLEDATGRQLIDRKPNRFAVTDAGKILYDECANIFGAVSQLPQLLAAEEAELSGHISIVMTSHVVSPHFDKALETFAQKHPKVTYSMVVEESTEVAVRIRQNQASFGICLLSEQPKNIDARVMCREFFGLYCGPRHRLFGRNDIALPDLKGEASVSFQTEIEGGPLGSVAQLRDRAGLAANLRGVSSNLSEVRRLTMANIGIGALPVHVAKRDVQLGQLWQLPPYSQLPMVEIYLLTNPRRSLSPPEAAFLALVDELIFNVPLDDRTYS